MTKEKYKKELSEIKVQMDDLYQRKAEARRAFLQANAEFENGDKVRITNESSGFNKEKTLECFVYSCSDEYFTGEIRYNFRAIKKDGTMSEKSPGYISRSSKIELIEKANTKTTE